MEGIATCSLTDGHDPAAFPFMWTKGIRDIFSGLVILPFLLRGDRRTTATIFAIFIGGQHFT